MEPINSATLMVVLLSTCQLLCVSCYYSDTDRDFRTQEVEDYEIEARNDYYRHHHKIPHKYDSVYDDDEEDHHVPRKPYDIGDNDCDCSCQKCDNPPQCCTSMCNTCPGYFPQSSLVFIPYPYPIPLVPNIPINITVTHDPGLSPKEPDTTTDEPTTTDPTKKTPIPSTTKVTTPITDTPEESREYTMSTQPALATLSDIDSVLRMMVNPNKKSSPTRINKANKLKVLELIKSMGDDFRNIVVKTPEKLQSGNNKYMLTSLRRTKPMWTPKFGIVPIPDNMAEQLMTQLHAVKGSKRRQTRDVKFLFY